MKNKLTAFALALSLCTSASNVNSVLAYEENPLDVYSEIVAEFNEDYGTDYQLASYESVTAAGFDYYEEYDKMISMTEEEFKDYLYDAHMNAVANKLPDSVEVNHNSSLVPIGADMNNVVIVDLPNYVGTQKHYYGGSYSKYFYINATWSYGDGDYRYTNISGAGTYSDGTSFPYYHAKSYTSTLINSSTEVSVVYSCERFISAGVTDATHWSIKEIFTAGGGNTVTL